METGIRVLLSVATQLDERSQCAAISLLTSDPRTRV